MAVVQRLLKERGVRARRHHRIGLGLYANRVKDALWPDRPSPRSWTDRYPPELVVTGPRGWREVTVIVERRSGHYLLSLHDGSAPQEIRGDRPGKVVNLILAARPGTAPEDGPPDGGPATAGPIREPYTAGSGDGS